MIRRLKLKRSSDKYIFDPYKENGFATRRHYLEHLAALYGAPVETVIELADVLGLEEDFDGLVAALIDAEEAGEFE